MFTHTTHFFSAYKQQTKDRGDTTPPLLHKQKDNNTKQLSIMRTSVKKQLSSIMRMAWQLVKRNGFTMSQAMKTAWANSKLKAAMCQGIVKFYFTKVDGTTREAYGTLKSSLTPPLKGESRKSDTTQTYYDTEKQAWRCFKVANLQRMAH